jgi:hypothetical protein
MSGAFAATSADDSPSFYRGWDALGARFIVGAASGKPANDMMGQGVYARYRLNRDWLLGFAVDAYAFDFEGPAGLLGLQQSLAVDTIDADASRTSFSMWAEREIGGADHWLQPFLLGGFGVGLVEVDLVTGPLQSGGTFDISTDPDTEFAVFGGAGLRSRLASRVTLELVGRVDYHLADWQVRDRVSNREAKIGGYHAIGGYVGLTWRF